MLWLLLDYVYVFFFLASYVPFIFSKETYKLHKDARRKLIHGALVRRCGAGENDKRLNFKSCANIRILA